MQGLQDLSVRQVRQRRERRHGLQAEAPHVSVARRRDAPDHHDAAHPVRYRWFLLCNPVGNDEYPFDPALIYNYALDRMDGKVEVVEGKAFIETPIDIDSRFEEIIGVTYQKGVAVEDIFFAVKPQSVDYIRTKYIHSSQDEVNLETEKDFKKKYPSLKDCKFFFVSCRPNYELFSRFASYGDAIVVVEPKEIRERLQEKFKKAYDNYDSLLER